MKTSLQINNLSFCYKNKPDILKNITFSLQPGELVGILGKNGSGKSTLFNAITNCNSNYKGEVLVDNKNIRKYSIKQRAQKIGYIPQKQTSTPDFISVEDYVLSGRRPYSNFGFYNKEDFEIAEEQIQCFNLQNLKDKMINEISGGEFQRTQLAKIAAQNTNFIICDEPVSALDVKYQLEFFRNIQNLIEMKNAGVLVSIHDLNLAMRFCHRIIIIDNCEIIFDGETSKLDSCILEKTFDVDIQKISFEDSNNTKADFLYFM